jgi:ABC-type transporter MlaC component
VRNGAAWLVQHFGVAAMAQQGLGPHWQKRMPAEKQAWMPRFGELFECSYIKKIACSTGKHKVLYTKETDDDGYASMQTTISDQHNTNIEVDDRLLHGD